MEVLEKLHEGHFGVDHTKLFAQETACIGQVLIET